MWSMPNVSGMFPSFTLCFCSNYRRILTLLPMWWPPIPSRCIRKSGGIVVADQAVYPGPRWDGAKAPGHRGLNVEQGRVYENSALGLGGQGGYHQR